MTVVPVALRARFVLAAVGLFMLGVFFWPFVIAPGAALSSSSNAPLVFAAFIPLVLAVAIAEITAGHLDAKAVALLGIITAVGAALRPLGTGIAGLEPMFFLLILAGRAFGPGFGVLLGTTTMFTSALITGGFGPWLPYQMVAAAAVSGGAGLLPEWRDRHELAALAVYGAFAGMAYGLAMNLSFWPFTLGPSTALSFDVAAAPIDNLRRFFVFSVVTSLGFDVPRAILTATLIVLAGGPILRTFRRAGRRAAFAQSDKPAISSR